VVLLPRDPVQPGPQGGATGREGHTPLEDLVDGRADGRRGEGQPPPVGGDDDVVGRAAEGLAQRGDQHVRQSSVAEEPGPHGCVDRPDPQRRTGDEPLDGGLAGGRLSQ
jgi:hypothetical protein